tara:strand:- start:440 stop:973 length:534 start_codon:yes stop_codon:yes gene_type:complete
LELNGKENKMPKIIPKEVRAHARDLFLEGKSGREISERLSKAYNIKIAQPTIYEWAKRFKWKDIVVEADTKAREEIVESEAQKLRRLSIEHLDTYQALRKKASNELQDLEFIRAGEAAKALETGIEGERRVIQGMINLSFVQEVLNILVEEISDQETINKIALRLQTLVSDSSSNDK